MISVKRLLNKSKVTLALSLIMWKCFPALISCSPSFIFAYISLDVWKDLTPSLLNNMKPSGLLNIFFLPMKNGSDKGTSKMSSGDSSWSQKLQCKTALYSDMAPLTWICWKRKTCSHTNHLNSVFRDCGFTPQRWKNFFTWVTTWTGRIFLHFFMYRILCGIFFWLILVLFCRFFRIVTFVTASYNQFPPWSQLWGMSVSNQLKSFDPLDVQTLCSLNAIRY